MSRLSRSQKAFRTVSAFFAIVTCAGLASGARGQTPRAIRAVVLSEPGKEPRTVHNTHGSDVDELLLGTDVSGTLNKKGMLKLFGGRIERMYYRAPGRPFEARIVQHPETGERCLELLTDPRTGQPWPDGTPAQNRYLVTTDSKLFGKIVIEEPGKSPRRVNQTTPADLESLSPGTIVRARTNKGGVLSLFGARIRRMFRLAPNTEVAFRITENAQTHERFAELLVDPRTGLPFGPGDPERFLFQKTKEVPGTARPAAQRAIRTPREKAVGGRRLPSTILRRLLLEITLETARDKAPGSLGQRYRVEEPFSLDPLHAELQKRLAREGLVTNRDEIRRRLGQIFRAVESMRGRTGMPAWYEASIGSGIGRAPSDTEARLNRLMSAVKADAVASLEIGGSPGLPRRRLQNIAGEAVPSAPATEKAVTDAESLMRARAAARGIDVQFVVLDGPRARHLLWTDYTRTIVLDPKTIRVSRLRELPSWALRHEIRILEIALMNPSLFREISRMPQETPLQLNALLGRRLSNGTRWQILFVNEAEMQGAQAALRDEDVPRAERELLRREIEQRDLLRRRVLEKLGVEWSIGKIGDPARRADTAILWAYGGYANAAAGLPVVVKPKTENERFRDIALQRALDNAVVRFTRKYAAAFGTSFLEFLPALVLARVVVDAIDSAGTKPLDATIDEAAREIFSKEFVGQFFFFFFAGVLAEKTKADLAVAEFVARQLQEEFQIAEWLKVYRPMIKLGVTLFLTRALSNTVQGLGVLREPGLTRDEKTLRFTAALLREWDRTALDIAVFATTPVAVRLGLRSAAIMSVGLSGWISLPVSLIASTYAQKTYDALQYGVRGIQVSGYEEILVSQLKGLRPLGGPVPLRPEWTTTAADASGRGTEAEPVFYLRELGEAYDLRRAFILQDAMKEQASLDRWELRQLKAFHIRFTGSPGFLALLLENETGKTSLSGDDYRGLVAYRSLILRERPPFNDSLAVLQAMESRRRMNVIGQVLQIGDREALIQKIPALEAEALRNLALEKSARWREHVEGKMNRTLGKARRSALGELRALDRIAKTPLAHAFLGTALGERRTAVRNLLNAYSRVSVVLTP